MLTLAAALTLCVPLVAMSQEATIAPLATDAGRVEMRPSTGLVWTALVARGFAPGATMTVVHGDPDANRDYIIRLRFPDGYRFPVHWHPNSEHITVLSGTLLLAMGNTADESKLRRFGPGDFVYAPGRMAHFGGARGTTVLQLNGTGPFAINLGVPPAM